MAIKAADQLTIIDVTDAYSVMLSSEAHTFSGGTTGVPAGATCTTEVFAFCGDDACTNVSVDQTELSSNMPPGISGTVDASTNNSGLVRITFETTDLISDSCDVTIPVKIGSDIEMHKKFTFAVALKGSVGAQGRSVSAVNTYFLASSSASGITRETTGWSNNATTSATDKYLWMYQKLTYTEGEPTYTDPAIVSIHGATGDAGASITSVNNYFLASNKSTGVTREEIGTKTSDITTPTKKYLWSYQKINYNKGNPTYTNPTIVGVHGEKGDKGDDAISIDITSSAGIVFKNSTGSTSLVAHVYKGATEANVADNGVVTIPNGSGGTDTLGTVVWYKGDPDTNSSAVNKGAHRSITVNPSDVQGSQVFTARLEQ